MRERPFLSDGTDGAAYDLLLAVIPAPLLVGLAAAQLGPLSSAVGVGIGGLAALTLVAYALFGAAPRGRDRGGATDGAAAGGPADD